MRRHEEACESLWSIVLAGGEGLRLDARFVSLDRFLGAEHERWALRCADALVPPRNFSRDVLRPAQAELVVWHMPALTSWDPGTPRHVFQPGRKLDRTPPWLAPGRVGREH
jgi:hypothetical protein